MKLKYYLRGLGIGIVVTVFIMSVAFQNRKPMTDEEVKARATELGMIENTVLSEVAGKKDTKEDVPEISEDVEEVSKDLVETPDEENTENTENAENTENGEQDIEETEDSNIVKDTISITVQSGDSSWTVSQKMEEAGLVDSAKDFDTHLCRYGYDKKISVGTYKIPVGSSHEEMARILTKMD